jgi:hypothetical protein
MINLTTADSAGAPMILDQIRKRWLVKHLSPVAPTTAARRWARQRSRTSSSRSSGAARRDGFPERPAAFNPTKRPPARHALCDSIICVEGVFNPALIHFNFLN